MTYSLSENKASEMFIDSLQGGGGSSSIYCNCGRQHYAPSNLYGSDDEDDYVSMLQDALEEQKKNPEGIVINYEDDFVSAHDIDGKTYVDRCPCNGLYKYEEFIWKNRNAIRRYLKIRIEEEFRWAQEELTLNKLAGI